VRDLCFVFSPLLVPERVGVFLSPPAVAPEGVLVCLPRV